MALSSIVKKECPKCGKIAVESSRLTLGATRLIKLACGHLMPEAMLKSDDTVYSTIVSSDGSKLREYQEEGVRFGENANMNFILADEQGLGKTIQIASLLRLHRKKLLPAILVVPTSVKLQWMWEIRRWCGTGPEFLTQVIQSGKEKAMPGFQIYIVTYDMLKKEDMFDYVGDIKTIIADECQKVKNHLSGRAKAVQRFGSKATHRVMMSGTPIKNHAGEYFTALNLVAPSRFPSYQRYLDNYCDTYDSAYGIKVGGLKDVQRFKDDTKDIILRRTKAEVLADLSSLDRKFHHVELDPKLNKAYAAALKDLDELIYSEMNEFDRGAQTIAIMGRLRHITGISKVQECIDYITEFLLSTDRQITIFSHHQDVMDMLNMNLSQWCEEGAFSKPLVLHSGLSGDGRASLVQRFKDGASRIMLASTLAAGEGLNLQFCSDAIMLERQWNPANEEQAEARFHRFGQQNSVTITYMIASGTIDEYFTELVEVKRSIVAGAMDGKEVAWDQNSLMKDLSEMLVAKGKKRWSL